MKRIITIEITVPEGAEIVVKESSNGAQAPALADPEAVKRYFSRFLSDNGRKLYAAAASIERNAGPGYTLSDIAAALGIAYGSAQSWHRTSGRSARKWKDETGTEAPVRLKDLAYEWVENEHGMRSRYELPPGVSGIVAHL